MFTIGQPINIQPALNAYDTVLLWAGAALPRRDSVDIRIASETRNRTTSGTGSAGRPGIIDAPSAVGGWPLYENCTGPDDSDHDGMADEWEIENGLNPNVADDRNIVDEDGYTMLEKYLNNIESNLVSQKVCPGAASSILTSDIRGASYQWEENTGNGFVALAGQTDSAILLHCHLRLMATVTVAK